LLHGSTAPALHGAVSELLATKPEIVILDLAEVTAVEPAAVEALVAMATQSGKANIGFYLAGAARPAVTDPLRAAGALELFEIHESVQDVLDSP
jgi:anti-anti-sigma factor